MKLKIGDKEYTLNFGIGFVRELDENNYILSKNGVKFGTGLDTVLPMMLAGDYVKLSDCLYHATHAETARPTKAEVDAFVDTVENIENIRAEVIAELKKQRAAQELTEKYLKVFEKQKAMDTAQTA